MAGSRVTKSFSSFSHLLALWLGSHQASPSPGSWSSWVSSSWGSTRRAIAIGIATLMMVVVLQNTQNRDSAALRVKLDEIVTRVDGPRDQVVGIESASHEEIEELREKEP